MRPFFNSIKGILHVWRTEPNFRFRIIFTVVVIVLASYVALPKSEMVLLVVSLAMMLMAEIANTALEEVCDLITSDHNVKIGAIKDMLSATVFVAALPAIGILIFSIVPGLLEKF